MTKEMDKIFEDSLQGKSTLKEFEDYNVDQEINELKVNKELKTK